MCFNRTERFSAMINKIDSSVNFGAKFDKNVSRRLLDFAKNSHGLKMGVEARISHIYDWGDKDSVILLEKDPVTSVEKFVLKNDNFSSNHVAVSEPVSDSKNSLFIAFFHITKKAILDAEKSLMYGS